MNKNLFIALVVLVLVGGGVLVFTSGRNAPESGVNISNGDVSDVGQNDGQGRIHGIVTLGPTCPGPVQVNVPPSDRCAPKPYASTLSIKTTAGGHAVETVTVPESGIFDVDVSPGTYFIENAGKTGYPILKPVTVTVAEGETITAHINFDTGMR